MAAKKENLKAVKFLQLFVKTNGLETTLTDAQLQAVDIDVSVELQAFRNLIIKKLKRDKWELSLADGMSDLNGVKFDKNKKLMALLKQEVGKKISPDDLEAVDVFLFHKKATIGDYTLTYSRPLLGSASFTVSAK